jgi:hypothetical protein
MTPQQPSPYRVNIPLLKKQTEYLRRWVLKPDEEILSIDHHEALAGILNLCDSIIDDSAIQQPGRRYIITEPDVAKLEYHNPYGWGADIAKRCRSYPAPSEQEIREKVLDYLDEWVNSGENLTLFKWELREVLRELRSKQGEQQ